MQIDDIEEEQDIQSQNITFEDTTVNIDHAISKLRHHSNSNSETQHNTNSWPETAYICNWNLAVVLTIIRLPSKKCHMCTLVCAKYV